MVSNMKEAFGNMLLTDYIDGNPDRSSLPSPEVKNSHKKMPRIYANWLPLPAIF